MVRLEKDLNITGADGESIPVYIEGEAPESLPVEYFTVSEDYTSTAVTADNKAKSYLYEFTLKFYSTDAERLYSVMLEAIEHLKSKNYDISGVGYHSPTYKGWYARAVDVEKIENLEE
jgi:hypothetical protein